MKKLFLLVLIGLGLILLFIFGLIQYNDYRNQQDKEQESAVLITKTIYQIPFDI